MKAALVTSVANTGIRSFQSIGFGNELLNFNRPHDEIELHAFEARSFLYLRESVIEMESDLTKILVTTFHLNVLRKNKSQLNNGPLIRLLLSMNICVDNG